MPIKHDTPFYRTKLEEEQESRDRVHVHLNKDERRWLEALKMSDKESNDSTALKNAAFRRFKEDAALTKIDRRR